MKILIDNVDISEIKRICEYYPIDGITCNPTILNNEGRSPFDVLKEIRTLIGKEGQLHVQVISSKAEDIVEEAHHIQSMLGKNTYIKIPVIPEGLKAMKFLSKEGAYLTGTAIYNQMQGYLAAKAGAHYVAPYINRIDNLGYDGIKVAKDIQDILKHAGLRTEVLAASFKNSQQVIELVKYGIGACTISPDVIDGLIRLDAVTNAVDMFIQDFEVLCGKGKTMKDIE